MKKYEEPILETIYFLDEDIITASGLGETDTPDPGEGDF